MRFAMREARRHYVGQDRDYQKAWNAMKEAISLRVEYKLHLVRWIPMAANLQNATHLSDDDKQTVQRYRGYVEEELKRQLTATSGQDLDHHAVLIRFPRTEPKTDIEAYMIAQLYIAERGCAATEFLSAGEREKLVAISDYATYVSANAPPVWSLRESMTKLQRIYPERLEKMIITDPPYWMRMLYNVLYPFLAEKTTRKITMTTGDVERKAAFQAIIDVERPPPLIQGDLSMSAESVDLDTYMNQLFYETLPSTSTVT